MGLKSRKINKDSSRKPLAVEKQSKTKRKAKNSVLPAAEDQKPNAECLVSKCNPGSGSSRVRSKPGSPAHQKRSWKRLPRPSATSLDQILKLSFKRHHAKKKKEKIGDNNEVLKLPLALAVETDQQNTDKISSESDPMQVPIKSQYAEVKSKNHQINCFGYRASEPSTSLNCLMHWPKDRSYKTLPSNTRRKENKHPDKTYISVDDFNNNTSMFSEDDNMLKALSPNGKESVLSNESVQRKDCRETYCSSSKDNSVTILCTDSRSSSHSSSFSRHRDISNESKLETASADADEYIFSKKPALKSVSMVTFPLACRTRMQAELSHHDEARLDRTLSDATEDVCESHLLQNETPSCYQKTKTDNTADDVMPPCQRQAIAICRLEFDQTFASNKHTAVDQSLGLQNAKQANCCIKRDRTENTDSISFLMSDPLMDPVAHDTLLEESKEKFDVGSKAADGSGVAAQDGYVLSNDTDTSTQQDSVSNRRFVGVKQLDRHEAFLSTELQPDIDGSEDGYLRAQAVDEISIRRLTESNKAESISLLDEGDEKHSQNTSTCSLPSMEFSTGLDTNSVPDVNYNSSLKKLETNSSSLKSPSHISSRRGSISWLKNRSFFLRVTESRRKQHKREWEKKKSAPVCHRLSSHSQREDVDEITNDLKAANSAVKIQSAEIETLRHEIAAAQNIAREEEYLRLEAEVGRVNAEHESRLLKVEISVLRDLLSQKKEVGSPSAEGISNDSNLKFDHLLEQRITAGSIGTSQQSCCSQTNPGDAIDLALSKESYDQGYFSIPRQTGDFPFSPGQSPSSLTKPMTALPQPSGHPFKHHKLEDILKYPCGADTFTSSYPCLVCTNDVGSQTDAWKHEDVQIANKSSSKSGSDAMLIVAHATIDRSEKKSHLVSRLAVCFAQIMFTIALLENHDEQKFNVEKMVVGHVIPSWKQIFTQVLERHPKQED